MTVSDEQVSQALNLALAGKGTLRSRGDTMHVRLVFQGGSPWTDPYAASDLSTRP